ncbi:hypothetical protein [Pseudomonas sp. NFIX28]|uniref:hypothetical protein n=1 Tax=Pseudomonas sp. NFIX28 TaxID=1566235 RepID=UPI000B84AB0C|nr:hypothetical protein [Pseudomonas sp. NFIX28]
MNPFKSDAAHAALAAPPAPGHCQRRHSLVSALDDYQVDSGRFTVLRPRSRHLPPKLRVFVDFLGERLVLGGR